MAALEGQLEQLDKKRLEEAAEYEKREMARRDSVRNSKLEIEIKALKDMLTVNESNKLGIRVVIDVKRGEPANIILNKLYKMTQLQVSFGIIFLSIKSFFQLFH